MLSFFRFVYLALCPNAEVLITGEHIPVHLSLIY